MWQQVIFNEILGNEHISGKARTSTVCPTCPEQSNNCRSLGCILPLKLTRLRDADPIRLASVLPCWAGSHVAALRLMPSIVHQHRLTKSKETHSTWYENIATYLKAKPMQ